MKKKVDAVGDRIRSVKQRITGAPDFKDLDSFYRSGDYRKAVFIAQDIVAAHPGSREAKYKLALALSRNSQLLRAEEILTSIVTDDGAGNQPERRYRRALEVVRTKIADAEAWVKKVTDSSDQSVGYTPATGKRNSPAWLRLTQIHEDRTLTGSDYFRASAQILMEMHSWSEAAVQYRNLVLTGKSGQKDLRNYAKCLMRAGRREKLTGVLAELNNLRSRACQALLTVEDLAATVGEYQIAAESLNTAILNGYSDLSELDKSQLRLGRAGRLLEALQVGKVMATIQHSDKLALRTGLYAEQLGMAREAVAQYDSIVASSPGATSVASIRLSRLVAKEAGDAGAKAGLCLAYGHWAKFDKDNLLLLELAGMLETNGYHLGPQTAEMRPLMKELHISTKPGREIRSDENDTSRLVKTLVDEVRREVPTCDGGVPIDPGANASPALRRACSLRHLAEGASASAVHEAQKLVFGADQFVAEDLAFLAYILARVGRFVDAMHALSASEENTDPFRYQASRPGARHKQVFRYLALRRELPLANNVFLWESNFGDRVDCNPYAIWKEVCERDTAGEYLHVWVCNDPCNAPADVLKDKQTVITKRESAGYWLALAVAKYLVNNASFSHEFLKRNGQVHVNTWHGTPLKALGRDDHDSPYDYGNVSRNILHCSDLLMPSGFTADTFLNRYSVGSLCSADVHIVGQARNDRLVNMSRKERLGIRESLGIDPDETFVLYAPTWRGGSKSSWFDLDRLEQDLASLVKVEGLTVGFRGHPLALRHLANIDSDVLVPEPSVSTYDLLAIADVLVTDYSSLGVDFLCRELPVIYYVHDYDEYSATRGLYFSQDEFPGYVVNNIDELVEALRLSRTDRLLSTRRMKELRDTFAPFDDGKASSRAADVLLASTGIETEGNESRFNTSPILLTHDLSNRDSLEAFVRTANSLESAGYSVVVVFNQTRVTSDIGLVEVLDRLSPDIHVLPRKGMFVQSVSEFAASEQFLLNDELVDVGGSSPYLDALEREAFRIFGNIRFSLAVSWGADDIVLAGLCAYGVNAERRIAYLDTDIADLWTRCFPSRKRVLQLFPGFDAVLVSSVHSRDWLSRRLPEGKVRYVERSIEGTYCPRHFAIGPPEGSVVLVGSDTDLPRLRSAIAAVAQCAEGSVDFPSSVPVYVQGSAREAVAEVLRQDSSVGQLAELRTDEFPYGGTDNLRVLVDCGGGDMSSVASLDAVEAGVPVVKVASVLSAQGEECSYGSVDILASAIEAARSNVWHSQMGNRDTSTNMVSLMSQYLPCS